MSVIKSWEARNNDNDAPADRVAIRPRKFSYKGNEDHEGRPVEMSESSHYLTSFSEKLFPHRQLTGKHPVALYPLSRFVPANSR